jgi:hypothetical protein
VLDDITRAEADSGLAYVANSVGPESAVAVATVSSKAAVR